MPQSNTDLVAIRDGIAATNAKLDVLIGEMATSNERLTGIFNALSPSIASLPLPAIFADFSTDTYEHNGSAKAVGDLFVADETQWGPFAPAKAIIPGIGLRNVDNDCAFPALHPDVLSTFASDGCSIVIEAYIVGYESGLVLCADTPAWSHDIECLFRAVPGKVESYVNGALQPATEDMQPGTLTKIGVTFLSDRTKFCIGGGVVDEATFADVGSSRNFIALAAPIDGYFKSVAVYPPLIDTDLQSVTSD